MNHIIVRYCRQFCFYKIQVVQIPGFSDLLMLLRWSAICGCGCLRPLYDSYQMQPTESLTTFPSLRKVQTGGVHSHKHVVGACEQGTRPGAEGDLRKGQTLSLLNCGCPREEKR